MYISGIYWNVINHENLNNNCTTIVHICLLRLYSDNAINKTFIPPNISWTIIIRKSGFSRKVVSISFKNY